MIVPDSGRDVNAQLTPFCKKFAEWMRIPSVVNVKRIILIYLNFPEFLLWGIYF